MVKLEIKKEVLILELKIRWKKIMVKTMASLLKISKKLTRLLKRRMKSKKKRERQEIQRREETMSSSNQRVYHRQCMEMEVLYQNLVDLETILWDLNQESKLLSPKRDRSSILKKNMMKTMSHQVCLLSNLDQPSPKASLTHKQDSIQMVLIQILADHPLTPHQTHQFKKWLTLNNSITDR